VERRIGDPAVASTDEGETKRKQKFTRGSGGGKREKRGRQFGKGQGVIQKKKFKRGSKRGGSAETLS